jgi:hypothetical protein
MPALGHKQTFAVQNGMSALPPKADMGSVVSATLFADQARTISAAPADLRATRADPEETRHSHPAAAPVPRQRFRQCERSSQHAIIVVEIAMDGDHRSASN